MNELQAELKKAFQTQGLSPDLAAIVPSNLPTLCDYQCNGALSGAKILKSNPLKIAENVLNSISEELKGKYDLTVVKPGFIKLIN